MQRLKLTSRLSVDWGEDEFPDHVKVRLAIRSATRVDQRTRSVKRILHGRKRVANPNEPKIGQLSYVIVDAEIVADGPAAVRAIRVRNTARPDDISMTVYAMMRA
jgi:hypothetical protein